MIEDADGVGEVGNAVCGDIMKIYLKIEDGTVSDVKFETGSPLRAEWGIWESPPMSRSRMAETLMAFSSR